MLRIYLGSLLGKLQLVIMKIVVEKLRFSDSKQGIALLTSGTNIATLLKNLDQLIRAGFSKSNIII